MVEYEKNIFVMFNEVAGDDIVEVAGGHDERITARLQIGHGEIMAKATALAILHATGGKMVHDGGFLETWCVTLPSTGDVGKALSVARSMLG